MIQINSCAVLFMFFFGLMSFVSEHDITLGLSLFLWDFLSCCMTFLKGAIIKEMLLCSCYIIFFMQSKCNLFIYHSFIYGNLRNLLFIVKNKLVFYGVFNKKVIRGKPKTVQKFLLLKNFIVRID